MPVRFKSNLPQTLKKMRLAFAQRMVRAVKAVANELKHSVLRGPRSGRMYRLPGRGNLWYQASAPGQPPAFRTGAMNDSVSYTVGVYGHRILGRVGALDTLGRPYPRYLEGGTTRMQPRPWLRKTMLRLTPRVGSILNGRTA
jgi:hypothetical protein